MSVPVMENDGVLFMERFICLCQIILIEACCLFIALAPYFG